MQNTPDVVEATIPSWVKDNSVDIRNTAKERYEIWMTEGGRKHQKN